MKKDISPELIRKYLSGQCTLQETVIVNEWYNSFEDEQDSISMLSFKQQDELKVIIRGRIKSNIRELDQQKQPIQRRISIRRNIIYYLSGFAAVVLIVLQMTVANHTMFNQDIVATTIEKMTVTNLTKSIQKQILSDGSIVWLSPQSKIKYPKMFAGRQREVHMIGEAFFEVHKDKNHPFIIYSGGVITRVLGTSFRIRAFKNIPTEISVISGKVSVGIPHEKTAEVVLFPNQKATYWKDKELLKKDEEEKTSPMRIWQKTTMAFDNVPLSQVMAALNKEFSVRISAEDGNLTHFLLKADFTEQNLPAILEMLEKSLNLTYKIDEEGIILNSKN
ncbi:MAG: FecR family protein [Daejeonella sp.]